MINKAMHLFPYGDTHVPLQLAGKVGCSV